MRIYEANTVGGRLGHRLRRALHVVMLLVPILYYYYEAWLSNGLLIILLLVIATELWRLKKHYLFFGQRAHESTHLSSFAWGAIAMIVVLLLVPHAIYAIPIVAGCAIGDPLIGILKERLPWYVVRPIAFLVIGFIWWVCRYFMPLPIWFPWVVSAMTVLVEWPNFYWIDDNALMQVVPLMLLLMTHISR